MLQPILHRPHCEHHTLGESDDRVCQLDGVWGNLPLNIFDSKDAFLVRCFDSLVGNLFEGMRRPAAMLLPWNPSTLLNSSEDRWLCFSANVDVYHPVDNSVKGGLTRPRINGAGV